MVLIFRIETDHPPEEFYKFVCFHKLQHFNNIIFWVLFVPIVINFNTS